MSLLKAGADPVLWLPKGIWWGEGEVPSRIPVKRVIVLIDHSENTLLL